jgi:hypothetical protein
MRIIKIIGQHALALAAFVGMLVVIVREYSFFGEKCFFVTFSGLVRLTLCVMRVNC